MVKLRDVRLEHGELLFNEQVSLLRPVKETTRSLSERQEIRAIQTRPTREVAGFEDRHHEIRTPRTESRVFDEGARGAEVTNQFAIFGINRDAVVVGKALVQVAAVGSNPIKLKKARQPVGVGNFPVRGAT